VKFSAVYSDYLIGIQLVFCAIFVYSILGGYY